jgi:hypothetical protein
MATPEEQALAEIDRQRFAVGLGRVDRSSLLAQQATSQATQQAEFGDVLDSAQTMATLRAQLAFETLRDAGLAGVAQRLRQAQRAAAFDAARRGVTGGSRQIERTQEAQGQAEVESAQVINQAQQTATQQREAELAPLFRVQEQLEQPTTFQSDIDRARMGIAQEQLGMYDIENQSRRINLAADDARAQGRAQNIRSLFDAVGPGVKNAIGNSGAGAEEKQ